MNVCHGDKNLINRRLAQNYDSITMITRSHGSKAFEMSCGSNLENSEYCARESLEIYK